VLDAKCGLVQEFYRGVPPTYDSYLMYIWPLFFIRVLIDPRYEWSIYSGWGVLEFKLPPSQLLIGWKNIARGKLWQNPRDEHQNIMRYELSILSERSTPSSTKALQKLCTKLCSKLCSKLRSKLCSKLPLEALLEALYAAPKLY
jgi:hypothetical protein